MCARRRTIEIFQYNAFTDQPFGGNPAGVVTEASGLADADMQRIAQQLNLAETAFLVPPTLPDADVRLRWFTPTREVTLCGHATIAAFTAAADRGIYALGEGEECRLNVETLSGTLQIKVARRGGAHSVAMRLPIPRFRPADIDREAYAKTWGLAGEDIAGNIQVLADLEYWYIPVRNLAALKLLSMNVEKQREIAPSAAFAFHTTETVDSGSDWHIRFFAPFHGVPEDIVTGSAHGPMGVLRLQELESRRPDGWSEFIGEQGDLLERPGRVQVRVGQKKGAVNDLEIVGGAVSMLEGQIRI